MTYETLCAILYNMRNLKNVKNTQKYQNQKYNEFFWIHSAPVSGEQEFFWKIELHHLLLSLI